MKNFLLIGILSGMVGVTSLMASDITVGYKGSSYGPYQYGEGGEITVSACSWLDVSVYGTYAKNIGVSGSFQTFCVDSADKIYANSTYHATVSTSVTQTSGKTTVSDPISVGTGWLYSQFATGTWDSTYGLSYSYTGSTSSRLSSANLLQQAIWWLEGENGVTYNSKNPYMLAVVKKFGSSAAAEADGGWSYGVYALVLTDSSGKLAQNLLVYTGVSSSSSSSSSSSVPDGGATCALLGMGMAGMGLLFRRVRK